MPPLPPFSLPSMNVLPPPPTVLMSNIPPLLPPGTAMPPNSHHPNGSVSSSPSPLPTINVMASLENQIHSNVDNSVSNQSETEAIEISELIDTSENAAEIKLPPAVEKVLALKTVRAQEYGIDPDIVLSLNVERSQVSKTSVLNLISVDDEDNVEERDAFQKQKDSKNKRRKKKKKKSQIKRQEYPLLEFRDKHSRRDSGVDVDIEYVQEVIDTSDPLYKQFITTFEKFKLKENEEMVADAGKNALNEMFNSIDLRKKPAYFDDGILEEEKPKLSKKKLKKLSRMSVAELKLKVNRPELVELHDVTAKDPVLLLHLKASRNTVPVPRHWCFKRKYLQGKRGFEKPAFELPDFIKRTGIMEMRQVLLEKEEQKTMKAKVRESVRPKLGKIDIDYQKLHDAFYKWQTKLKMTVHGDLYYEGKEFETRLKEKKPGDLSVHLRIALGMPTGPNANKCPPPWLIAMQRYGPPPSYPNLKISGLNAPIPDSCSFGYHAGGWGKPPVDETGRPLYGDVFGMLILDNQPLNQEEKIDHTLWGELESESSEEEEEEKEDANDKAEDGTGLVTPAEGLITPSGFSSILAGMERPDTIELRKRKVEVELAGGEMPTLYTILSEKKTEYVSATMMGSTHIYDIAAAIPDSKLKASGIAPVLPQGIEVALDPSELEIDTAAMAARYAQTMREHQLQLQKEGLSDMVAEHAARQKSKRKKQLDSAKPPKKYKEFKF
nr:splicing factor 3B subunit 2-like [Parasteatoda tepidariorum]